MEEKGFLRAIAADPADDRNRLIYADWLEERGDPRGEYIRLRLSLRQPRGRKRARTRLAGLSDAVDGAWRRQVFAVPKLAIRGYRRVEKPVTEPVTKFGGQPVWLTGPSWPVGRHGERMQFVCQVRVPDFFGPPLAGKMIYVFAVHPEFPDCEQFYGRISPLHPHEGDNAVVIQPHGDSPAPTRVLPPGAKGQRRRKKPLRVEPRAMGPTLYDEQGRPGEWLPDLEPRSDPDFTTHDKAEFPGDDALERYWEEIRVEKVGGTPRWGNALWHEIESLVADPDWRLLLQFDYYHPCFSVWGGLFGWSVWVTRDGRRGLLMGGR
jgi:uncharacterized protein (TIGR02996 family)